MIVIDNRPVQSIIRVSLLIVFVFSITSNWFATQSDVSTVSESVRHYFVLNGQIGSNEFPMCVMQKMV